MVIGFDAKRAFHNTSGLGNYSRDLIRILAEGFPQHEYLLYNPGKGRVGWNPPWTALKIQYPDRWVWKKLSAVWRQGPVARQISRDGVDIYHGLSNEIPRGIDQSRTRVVVSIHDLIFIRYPELFKPVDRKIYYNKFRYAAEHADLVIAISEQTKRDIVSWFNIPESKIAVHYQGCHAVFKTQFSTAQKEVVRTKLGLPEKYILNVGTIEKRKNMLTVIEALRDSDKQLVMVGRPTSYKTELLQYIEKHGMKDRVHFPQNVPVDWLAMLYQMADLFVYPSVFEGFGIPIIEALYSRVPVITSHRGCFAEAGGPGSCYLDPSDVSAWRDAIFRISSDPQRAEQMVDTGLEYVQRFNDDQVGKSLMALYENLMKPL